VSKAAGKQALEQKKREIIPREAKTTSLANQGSKPPSNKKREATTLDVTEPDIPSGIPYGIPKALYNLVGNTVQVPLHSLLVSIDRQGAFYNLCDSFWTLIFDIAFDATLAWIASRQDTGKLDSKKSHAVPGSRNAVSYRFFTKSGHRRSFSLSLSSTLTFSDIVAPSTIERNEEFNWADMIFTYNSAPEALRFQAFAKNQPVEYDSKFAFFLSVYSVILNLSPS
jgi:hypothetical protein